jgi:hypothetical protein
MNQITANLIFLFVTTLLISVFYWRVAHKVIIKHVLYRLFARRDALRRMAIDGDENVDGFAYREVESMICKTISVIPSISLVSFFCFVYHNSSADTSESEKVHDEASVELNRLLDKTVKDALLIMALNSPILFVFSFIGASLLWIAGRFNKVVVIRQAESFVDDLPVSGGLQIA